MGADIFLRANNVMNVRIYTHQPENNKASSTWHAAKFDSDSCIGQYTYICLRAFKYEVIYTSTTYALKWGVITY